FISDYERTIRAGDYHSGPLSIIIPFGVMGVLAMMCFFISGLRVVFRNMRYGEAQIKNINTFLFSFYVGRLLYFILFFGGIEIDLWLFVSTVGVSLAINGGVKGPAGKPVFKMDRQKRGRANIETTELSPA